MTATETRRRRWTLLFVAVIDFFNLNLLHHDLDWSSRNCAAVTTRALAVYYSSTGSLSSTGAPVLPMQINSQFDDIGFCCE